LRLLIDSSGPQLTCALADRDGGIVGTPLMASGGAGVPPVTAGTAAPPSGVHTSIDAAVTELLAGQPPSAIKSICVGLGPGSFIGTRVAVSFANGFAAASPGVKLYGVNSLAAIAAAQPAHAVLRDARRGQWYVWLADGTCELRDAEGAVELLASGRNQNVIIEWNGPDEPPVAALLRQVGCSVSSVTGVPAEGLLKLIDSVEPQEYVEPVYLRGFT